MHYSKKLIKKWAAVLLIMGTSIYCIAAHTPVQNTDEQKEGTVSGDFVIYRDYSWKNPTWIGFLYYDDETYGAVLHTPETNSRISILFSCKPQQNTLELTGQKIISAITQDDTFGVNYLMTLLPALYEKKLLPAASHSPAAQHAIAADMFAFGGAVTLTFDNTVPLFHLKNLTNAKNGLVLELLEQGSIRGSGEHTFYEFTPPVIKQAVNQFKRDKKAKKETISVHNHSFTLDSQWTKIADNSFLCGNTAFLTINTLTIPAVPLQTLPESAQLIRFFSTSGLQAQVLIPHQLIEGTAENFMISQSVYDMQQQKINKDIKRCIKNSDGSFTIISLTVDSHAYSAEKSYFNGLFPVF
ncbi:MAG: hypothetical protein ACTTH8_06810 [Treponema sp.]